MQTAKALLEEFWSPLDSNISVEYPLRRGLSASQLEEATIETLKKIINDSDELKKAILKRISETE